MEKLNFEISDLISGIINIVNNLDPSAKEIKVVIPTLAHYPQIHLDSALSISGIIVYIKNEFEESDDLEQYRIYKHLFDDIENGCTILDMWYKDIKNERN